jgi:hypothetical protein
MTVMEGSAHTHWGVNGTLYTEAITGVAGRL